MDIKERQQKIEDAKIEENHQKIEESLQDIGDKQRNTRRNIREPRIKVSEKLSFIYHTLALAYYAMFQCSAILNHSSSSVWYSFQRYQSSKS